MATQLSFQKLKVIVLFLIYTSHSIAQSVILEGKVVSKRKPMAYATLVSLTDSKCGTVCNEHGDFKLWIPAFPQKIVVSCLGYKDTTVTLTTVSIGKLTISLNESPILLPQLTVKPNSHGTFLLGSPKEGILKKEEGYYFLKASQIGAGLGTVFDTYKQPGVINTISVFVAEPTPTKYLLTVYSLDDIGIDYRLYSKETLRPLIDTPLVFVTGKTGWIDIENLKIPLPNKYLVVMLTKVESNVALNESKTNLYEYRVGRQWSNGAAKRHIYTFGNQYAIMAKNDDISAVYITCQK